MIVRCVYDIVVEDEQYLDKVEWEDVGEGVGVYLQHVAMQKYGIAVERVERVGEHVHDARKKNCKPDYDQAEDGKG